MNDEFTSDERLENLAYNYQTLRCWIINSILSGKTYTPEEWWRLQTDARRILEETK